MTLKGVCLTVLALGVSTFGHAAIFTANSSGDFNSPSTWTGGIVPPTMVMLDQIVIPSGISVIMDEDIELSGALAALDVDGQLTSSAALTLTLGNLSGTGNVVVDAMNVMVASTFNFTGDLTANTLNSATGFQSSAIIVVNNSVTLVAGTFTVLSGGTFDLGANGTIFISGGMLAVGTGGSVALVNPYSVVYTGVSAVAGVELTGSGLRNVTVDVPTGSSVTLASDLTLIGVLTLTNGRLVLAGNDLTLNGAIGASGNGTVSATNLSDISINSAGGTVGTLAFTGGLATVNNLIVNVGAGNQANISGTLTVNGTLQLNSGVLNFHNTDLTVDGAIIGAGQLSGNSGSDLTIESIVGATTALDFAAGGRMVNNLSIAVGNGVAVSLASDLTVLGDLALSGGSDLDLNGRMFTLGVGGTLSGSGSFLSTVDGALTINATADISALRVVGTIGNFTVNSVNGSVALGADLVVEGLFYLQSGILVLNGRDLTVRDNIGAAGSGTISSSATSDISVSGATTPVGRLYFTEGANTVGTLNVAMFNNGQIAIGTDLHVANTLAFEAGRVNIGSNMLTIDGAGTITGQNSGTYVITEVDGSLERSITAGGSVVTTFPVGTEANYAPANISLATGSTSGRVNVGVMEGVWSQGTTGTDLAIDQPLVDATWNVASSVATNLDLNLQVIWAASMEVNNFDRTASYISHHSNGAWDVESTSSATAEGSSFYSMARSGITVLSPFAVFDESTTTAINDVENAIAFGLYPNPTSDNIVITEPSAIIEALNMEIYNAAGQLVGNQRLTDAVTTIPVNGLIPGNYLVRLYNSTINASQRFVKM